MKKALLVMDLINDIVHAEGSVGKDGFYEQVTKHKVLSHTSMAISYCREAKIPVIYVVVGFSKGYPEWNEDLKVFQNVKNKKQVLLNTWATQVCDELKPEPDEMIITKNRVDPFYGTNLDIVLRSINVSTLYLCGVSSDLVVLSAVFSGHDRGYTVHPLVDCICSNDDYSNQCAINTMKKLSTVYDVQKLMKEGSQ
jgi:nicotinamidase-related amidase